MLPFDMDMISTIAKRKMNRCILREGSNYPDFCGAKTVFKRTTLLNLGPKFAVPVSNLDPEACYPYDC